jgi:type 1 glutamine amidotransferase
MTNKINITLLLLSAILFFSCSSNTMENNSETEAKNEKAVESIKSILIFSKTNGYRHESIETGQKALSRLAAKNNWKTELTEDSTAFNSENLAKFAAVIFLSTTGDVLGAEEEAAFEKYITNGGGYFGIHAAADTEYDWPFYNQLVGAYFESHPNDPNIREATVMCKDKSHVCTSHLPEKWVRNDEWYNYKSIQSNLKILLELDETTYEGGTNGDFHPIAWYHDQGKGRAIYTGGGHTTESFGEELFLQHLEGAMKYAIGE